MGYAFSSLDELGDGVVRKIRPGLGITAFGANAWVLAPGVEARPHFHEQQDELYFVYRGRARFRLPGETRELGPGGLCHVEAATPRQIVEMVYADVDESLWEAAEMSVRAQLAYLDQGQRDRL